VWWIFTALGDKEIAPARSLMNLLRAGAYAAFGLFAGYVLVLRRPARDVVTLWLIWSALFGMQAYTSGIGWNVNHLGPGVVLATSWFLVAIARLWPKADISTRAGAEHGMAWWQHIAQQLGAAAIVLFVFAGAQGAIRPPVNPIPADLERYIADIEAEFEDLPAEQVLLDSGTWVYLEEGVVMKDRAWRSRSITVRTNRSTTSCCARPLTGFRTRRMPESWLTNWIRRKTGMTIMTGGRVSRQRFSITTRLSVGYRQ